MIDPIGDWFKKIYLNKICAETGKCNKYSQKLMHKLEKEIYDAMERNL
jgi:hypothetical protein